MSIASQYGLKGQKSAAARKDVPSETSEDGRHLVGNEKCQDKREEASHRQAGTQALPVDTIPKPKGGRPSTGFDKKAYMSAFMRDKRKADKLGLKVSEYRKMKGNENELA